MTVLILSLLGYEPFQDVNRSVIVQRERRSGGAGQAEEFSE
jgi:hypothetical protein